MDLPSARSSKLTFNARLEGQPLWSEDGKRVVFTATGAVGSLFEQSIGSDQEARLLLESPQHKVPTSISRDGRFLLYSSSTIGPTRVDVWVLPLTGERTPYPLIRRAFDQEQARFSPDGRWVAYVSNESGRREVLVRPFASGPANGGENAEASVMVSKSGGTAPRWRADGKELFFVTLEGAIVSVPVSARTRIGRRLADHAVRGSRHCRGLGRFRRRETLPHHAAREPRLVDLLFTHFRLATRARPPTVNALFSSKG